MTLLWQRTLDYANSGAASYSVRNKHANCPPGWFSKFNVYFVSHPTLPTVIDNASIGVGSGGYNTAATPWPIVFPGGASSITIPAGSAPVVGVATPPSPVSVQPGTTLITVVDFSSSANGFMTKISGADGAAYKAGASYSDAIVSGFSDVPGRSYVVATIDGGEHVPSTPSPAEKSWVLLDDQTRTASQCAQKLILRNLSGADYDEYQITLFNLYAIPNNSDGYGAVFSVLPAYDADGLAFDESASYSIGGMYAWGPWPPGSPVGPDTPPSGVGSHLTQVNVAQGMLAAADNISIPALGVCGTVTIQNARSVAGVNTYLTMQSFITQDESGGTHAPLISACGSWHRNNVGQALRGVAIRCNGLPTVAPWATIVGRAKLYGR